MVGVEDAGDLSVLVHARLISLVSFERTVPVHVVLSDVQNHRSVRGQRVGPVQLEARQLHREELVGLIVGNGVHDGHAHVAYLNSLLAGSLQDGINHTHGGGLTIRTGQAQPLGGRQATTLV